MRLWMEKRVDLHLRYVAYFIPVAASQGQPLGGEFLQNAPGSLPTSCQNPQ